MEKHYLKNLEDELILLLDKETKNFQIFLENNKDKIDYDNLEESLYELIEEYKNEYRDYSNDGAVIVLLLSLKLAVGEKLENNLKEYIKDIPDDYLNEILYGPTDFDKDKLKDILSVYENIPERFVSTFIEYYDTIENEDEYINNIYSKLQNYNRYHSVNSLGSIAADIENYYHTKLGLPPFEWMTQDDDLVRPTHAERFHKLFNEDGSKADGSSTPDGKNIVPGEEKYCRCYRRYTQQAVLAWWQIKKKEVLNNEI